MSLRKPGGSWTGCAARTSDCGVALGLPSPDAVAEAELPETAPTLFPISELEALPEVDARSPIADKVALVRQLFRGQDEVYAVRWSTRKAARPATPRRWRAAGTAATWPAGPGGTCR